MTTALWLDAPFAPISPGFDYWAILSTGGAVLNGRDGGVISYSPSLDFSDARNSQYAAGTMTLGVGVN